MGLFSSKVPNTINDKKWAKIQKGAEKAQAREGGFFGKKAVDKRHHYGKQKDKSIWS